MPYVVDDNPKKPGAQTYVRTKRIPFALQLGLFAGLIWGGLRWLFYYFRFTKVLPGFLVEPFFKHDFLAGTAGHFIGYAAFIVMSIIASLLFTFAGSKFKGPWPGLIFGYLWFILLYLWIGPLVGMLPGFGRNDWNSILVDGSIFILWGLFIGYSVTYEFNDERERNTRDIPSMLH